METITTSVQETVVETLFNPVVLLVAVLLAFVLLSGLGARLLDH